MNFMVHRMVRTGRKLKLLQGKITRTVPLSWSRTKVPRARIFFKAWKSIDKLCGFREPFFRRA